MENLLKLCLAGSQQGFVWPAGGLKDAPKISELDCEPGIEIITMGSF